MYILIRKLWGGVWDCISKKFPSDTSVVGPQITIQQVLKGDGFKARTNKNANTDTKRNKNWKVAICQLDGLSESSFSGVVREKLMIYI